MCILKGQRAIYKPESGEAGQSGCYQCFGRIWKV